MSIDNLAAIGAREGGDIDIYCTLKREKHKNKSPKAPAVTTQRPVLTRRLSGSHDDLYTGTRVSKVPEPTEYAVRVSIWLFLCVKIQRRLLILLLPQLVSLLSRRKWAGIAIHTLEK